MFVMRSNQSFQPDTVIHLSYSYWWKHNKKQNNMLDRTTTATIRYVYRQSTCNFRTKCVYLQLLTSSLPWIPNKWRFLYEDRLSGWRFFPPHVSFQLLRLFLLALAYVVVVLVEITAIGIWWGGKSHVYISIETRLWRRKCCTKKAFLSK